MEDNSFFESTLTFQRPLFIITQVDESLSFEWTIQEDMKLIELCNKYKHQWAKVANELKSKDPRQCNYRYKKLTSKYFKRKFNRTDDIALITLVDKHGNNWDKIESEMPGYNQKLLRERYEQIILPKRLSYSTQEEVRYQTEVIQTDFTDKKQEEVDETSSDHLQINSRFESSLDLSSNIDNSNNASDVISNKQFVNKSCLSLFTKYHQRLMALSIQIAKEYRYYSRKINKPIIKKLKIFVDIINSEIKASSSILRKMRNNPINFIDNSILLMNRNYKAIKISQLLLKFFRGLVKEI